MYLESDTRDPPPCSILCGPERPYMYYDGNPFCANDAVEVNRWVFVDFTQGGFETGYVRDPTMTVVCN